MSAVALSDGLLALIPESVTLHDGQVPTVAGVVPAPPWVYATITLPEVSARSMARRGHLHTVRARFLVYAGTAPGVRIVADIVDGALEGARPVVAGWRCSPVEQVNIRPAEEDRDVTITGTNRHPMYGVLEYLFTASPTS